VGRAEFPGPHLNRQEPRVLQEADGFGGTFQRPAFRIENALEIEKDHLGGRRASGML
jgi:hypothetical protein